MLIQIHNNLQHEQELEPRNINPKSIFTNQNLNQPPQHTSHP